MLSLKPRISKSWLDTRHARRLGYELAERLCTRCKGEKGVFLTLTYRRDEWEGPRDLYRATSSERHVRRFMERLGELLGTSFAGRWLCKLEFQKDGYVHFHLVVLGISRIEHSLLEHAWGYGFVWIERLNPARIRYVCKYVSKAGDLPAFLYFEPCRSVKVIRVSPGFWGDTEPRPPREKPEPTQELSAYVPIGMMIERAEHETVVRDDETGRFHCIPMGLGELGHWLSQRGAECIGLRKGWIEFKGYAWRRLAKWAPADRREATNGAALLHLIHC